MIVPSAFWLVIIFVTLCIFLLSLREAVVLSRLPGGHPERSLYWFNTLFLLCASGAVFVGGVYLDLPRKYFLSIMQPPEGASYAHERNAIVHRDEWVFVTKGYKDDVFAFHRMHAPATALQVVEDSEHMMFMLPSGPLFLTVRDVGSVRELHYSRVGTMSVVAE